MTQSKTETPPNIIGALALALPELGAVTKNKENPHFKSSYADLKAVIAALAPIAAHGLWFRQEPRDDAGSVGFETFYIYRDGSEMSAGITRIPVNKKDAQGHGSAQTYCRRYALQAAFGLAAEDDDADASTPELEPREHGRVSDMDLTEIISLCDAIGGNQPGRICKAYNISQLPELTPGQAASVKAKLTERLAERAKDETNREAENA